MLEHKLKLNEEKTEAVLFSSSFQSSRHTLPSSITLGSASITFLDTVRDLGFYLDSELTMRNHIKKTCQIAYSEI
jgi:hypothetical protein